MKEFNIEEFLAKAFVALIFSAISSLTICDEIKESRRAELLKSGITACEVERAIP
jgi:hypothetical protein